MQKREDVLGSLVQDIGEAVEEVTHGNDDVGLHPKVNVRSQKLEEKLDVCYADLR